MVYKEVATIRETAKRAKENHLGIGENFIRQACKSGRLKCTSAGSKTLIYWPNLISYLEHGDNKPAFEQLSKIRRIGL